MIVTLLTDFGDADGFVGAMRGVILSRAPDARLVDLAHHVPRGDVAKAARVLKRAAPCFPAGTVHLVVVDPGVGSARDAIAAEIAGHLFVAPDNGVLGLMGPPTRIRRLAIPSDASSTFHGRDVFAPAAARLAAGAPLEALGPAVHDLVRLPEGRPGRIVEVDQFGNLISDLPPEPGRYRIGAVVLDGPQPSYSAVASGEFVLVAGSEGTLEVAVRDGSAAERLGLGVGAALVPA